jgi:hypothetical protein
MRNPIYLNHKYLTRDGHKVHIIRARQYGEKIPYPVAGTIDFDGEMEDALWTGTGCFDADQRNHPYDLVKDITE